MDLSTHLTGEPDCGTACLRSRHRASPRR